jgi:hypothetical protein
MWNIHSNEGQYTETYPAQRPNYDLYLLLVCPILHVYLFGLVIFRACQDFARQAKYRKENVFCLKSGPHSSH